MNVLFFSRLFYPHIGGVEKHVLEISRLLLKKGHKVTIIAEQHSSRLGLKENVEGIRVFRIPDLREGRFKKFRIWKWLWMNKELIGDADLIHCHDVFFWYLPFKFLYLSKPVYTTFHGYEDYPLKLKSILVRKISEKLSYGNICIGDFIKKWYGTKADYVSYGGVKAFDIKNHKSNIKNYNSAVFVGRLDDQTGILTYNEAVKTIREKNPNFEFVVIGDGKLKSKIDKNIKVFNSQEKIEKYFQKYNFAFVSRYLSILEAMAAKRLVFATYDNPLKGDYLKMAPFAKYIIICKSSFDLISAISFYLKNSKAKEDMINNAYSWVKNQTWEKVTDTYLKLWI